MSFYYGDITLGDTINIKFTTRQFSTGAPFTLAGTPAVAAYPSNSTTEITAGITLTTDFDARTGLNNVQIVASGGNGYAAATNYALVITAGTVDSVSVVGEVVGAFSISNRPVTLRGITHTSAVIPTVTTTTTATNVTTVNGLAANVITATSINAAAITSAKIATDAIGATQIAANAITSGKIATDAIGSAQFAQAAADKVWSSATRTLTAFSTSLALSVWDVLESAIVTASSIGLKVKNNLDAAVTTRATPTQVNIEVSDVLKTDTVTLPGQSAPTNTPTMETILGWLYKTFRNKKEQTATEWRLYDDAGTTVDSKATVSDSAGVATKEEIASGP